VRRLLVSISAAVLFVGGASSSTAASSPRAATRTAQLVVHGSVRQVYVTGAEPGAGLELLDQDAQPVAHGMADAAGSVLFRDVTPGAGYRVEVGSDTPTKPVTVRDDDPPNRALYTRQRIGPGYGYLTTRDGTKLAINVKLPGPPDAGPYPTVIEYSGYDPANPESPQPASRLAQTLGYATVGVNMRGTGCSGGAWDYFEPLQSLDGYDTIETIAAQPWVQHGRVGMVGISYPGIAQLFVAATRPPHLAAITPLSVIDDTYQALYPGGIFNNGYALEWAKDRQSDAQPAPEGGQGWAKRRIAAGDAVCKSNQALRLQAPNVLENIEQAQYFDARRYDLVNPSTVVNRIQVPTFLAGAWQDEQVGGHWPDMIENFSPRVKLRVTATNGTHFEPFGPAIITRWAEFLDFYVARRVPRIPAAVRAGAAQGYLAAIGVPAELPPDRFAGETDFAKALARYEKEPPVRILFDNGAGGAPGVPIPAFEADLRSWPPPGLRPTPWYFTGFGHLDTAPPGRTRGSPVDRYQYDPTSMPRTSHPSGTDDYFQALPAYEWKPVPDGKSLAYLTDPLRRDVVTIGPGSVDLWLRSSADDVDLEVTLSEVRPDGKETYVQSGWLRASQRRLAPASTELEPRQSHAEADAEPLPHRRFTLARVALFPFGHVFRAGSQIRISVQAPGGNRPRWSFDALPASGKVVNEIARSTAHASRVVLPVVDGIQVGSRLPPCPSLRGQPCRDYVPPREQGG